jgi:molybdenum cofactor cytidylyltransferase
VITAIVLAAGASRRFGSQKLLAELRGKAVVRWTVERVLAAAPDEVIVVLGRDGEGVRDALHDLPVRMVLNERWTEGIGSSLRAGVAALTPDADAAMIVLGDQPEVSTSVVAALIEARSEGGGQIVVPCYRGERGHPVIFGAEILPELLAVEGDRGARDVIARDERRVTRIHIDAPAPVDVDTEEELQSLIRSAAAQSPAQDSRLVPRGGRSVPGE